MNLNKLKFAVLGITAALLLSGCETASPDVTDPPQKQASAIKSQGGMYKVGNPYKILGRWYYPKEDYSYSEVGTASWYGPDFHAKRTANNEKYDMHSLTAAHRTLPLPSIIRVTNMENGRSLVVRVNDRGPYARERIIDVSKKVAQLLGFLENGTAKVRVEVLEKESKNLKAALLNEAITDSEVVAAPTTQILKSNIGEDVNVLAAAPAIAPITAPEKRVAKVSPSVVPAASPQAFRSSSAIAPAVKGSVYRSDEVSAEETIEETEETENVSGDGYYVQAGAFSAYDSASSLVARLKKFGNAHVSKAEVSGKTFYRVRVGPFGRHEEAVTSQAKIRKFGIPTAHIVEK